jgi:hypothetical protein
MGAYEGQAIAALAASAAIVRKLNGTGVAWGELKALLKDHLPEHLDDRDEIAYQLVRKALTELAGREGEGWHTYPVVRGTQRLTYVKAGKAAVPPAGTG